MELPTLPQERSHSRRRRSAAISSPITRRSRCGRRSHLPAIEQRAGQPSRPTRRRSGCICTFRFAASGASFVTSASTRTRTPSEIEMYLSALSREIDLYARSRRSARAAVRIRLFRRRHAVSYLSNEQLQAAGRAHQPPLALGRGEGSHVRVRAGHAQGSEAADDQADRRHAAVSLGVEHFDDEILSINGRAHKSPEIERAYRWARDVGFPQINIDLIAGMLGETEDKWKYAVEKAIALDPDSVTIYQMEVPLQHRLSPRTPASTAASSAGRELGPEARVGRLRVQAVRAARLRRLAARTRW